MQAPQHGLKTLGDLEEGNLHGAARAEYMRNHMSEAAVALESSLERRADLAEEEVALMREKMASEIRCRDHLKRYKASRAELKDLITRRLESVKEDTDADEEIADMEKSILHLKRQVIQEKKKKKRRNED